MAAPTETFLPRRQEGDAGGGCPGRGFSLPFEERLGPRGWGVRRFRCCPHPLGGLSDGAERGWMSLVHGSGTQARHWLCFS